MANLIPIQAELPLECPSAKFAEIEGIQMGVLNDGTPYLTERGLARLCGVHSKTISDLGSNWQDERQKPRGKKIEQLIGQQNASSARLFAKTEQAGQKINAYPDYVCMAILEYYAFDADGVDKEDAQRNFRLLARKSLRDFIYERVGFDPAASKLESWRHYHDRILLNKLPAAYFSVFREIADIVVAAIDGGLIIDSHTIPDGSVGSHWAKHWKAKKLSERYGERKKYPHEYPEYFPQSAANVEANIYPLAALGEFRIWLENEYLPKNFPSYLDGKVKQGFLPKQVAGKLLISLNKGE